MDERDYKALNATDAILTVNDIKMYVGTGLIVYNQYNDRNENLHGITKSVFTKYKDVISRYNIDEIKPILYPLDCLTKPIWFEGKEVIVMEIIVAYALKEMQIKKDDCVVLSRMIMYNDNIHKIPYWCVQILTKFHFDINKLISRGLAISVTNEFNPYSK